MDLHLKEDEAEQIQEPSEAEIQFNKLYQIVPQDEVAENNLNNLSIKQLLELLELFNPYLADSKNPLWDGSIMQLKCSENHYSGLLLANYAESQE